MSTQTVGKRPSLWRRLFRGCGLLLAVTVVTLAIVGIWQRNNITAWIANLQAIAAEPEYAQGLAEPEEMLEYLLDRREHVALVSYTTNADGSINTEQPVIMHNADQPMPLASTIKIVILAGYAQQVEQGLFDPTEPVTLESWEQYYLPGTDGGAHPAALESLGIETGDQGFAVDPSQTVELDALARAMIAQSDNAATDYLLDQLGRDAIAELIDTVGLSDQDIPLSSLGMFLSWRNHEQPEQDTSHIEALAALSATDYAAEVDRLAELYVHTPWGQPEREWLQRNAFTTLLEYQAFAVEQLESRGSARDYATMMGKIAEGAFISPAVSERMRGYLDWPMERFPSNQEQFSSFGAKGGSLPGVRTQAFYLVPRAGDFGGQTRVVILFMHDMPISAYLKLLQTFGDQDFMLRLATDAAFAEQVQQAFE